MQTTTLPAQGKVTASEEVFPAIHGEFYGYAATFTPRRPLYAFMKCKSNKDRPHAFADSYPQECNLIFSFGNARITSIQAVAAQGQLDKVLHPGSFDETFVAPANISVERFYGIRARKEADRLAEIVNDACVDNKTSVDLIEGHVYAAMSKAGKFCLFYVVGLDKAEIKVEACHVLI